MLTLNVLLITSITLQGKHHPISQMGKLRLRVFSQGHSVKKEKTVPFPSRLAESMHFLFLVRQLQRDCGAPLDWAETRRVHQALNSHSSETSRRPLNFGPDYKKLHQVLWLHNPMNKMPTLCWADVAENPLTVPSPVIWWTGQWGFSILCFTFRIGLWWQPTYGVWNLQLWGPSPYGKRRILVPLSARHWAH